MNTEPLKPKTSEERFEEVWNDRDAVDARMFSGNWDLANVVWKSQDAFYLPQIEALQKQIAKLEAHNNALSMNLDLSHQERARLRKALVFFADSENYLPEHEISTATSAVELDGRVIAQKALYP